MSFDYSTALLYFCVAVGFIGAMLVAPLAVVVWKEKPWAQPGTGIGNADINVVNGNLVWNDRVIAVLPENPPLLQNTIAVINPAGDLDYTHVGTVAISEAGIIAPFHQSNT